MQGAAHGFSAQARLLVITAPRILYESLSSAEGFFLLDQ